MKLLSFYDIFLCLFWMYVSMVIYGCSYIHMHLLNKFIQWALEIESDSFQLVAQLLIYSTFNLNSPVRNNVKRINQFQTLRLFITFHINESYSLYLIQYNCTVLIFDDYNYACSKQLIWKAIPFCMSCLQIESFSTWSFFGKDFIQ